MDAELSANSSITSASTRTTAAHGHGIYVQNTAAPKSIIDNILFNGFSSASTRIPTGGRTDHVHMDGNTIFNHGVPSKQSGRRRTSR